MAKTGNQISNEMSVALRMVRLARAYGVSAGIPDTDAQHDIIDEIAARAHRILDNVPEGNTDGN